MPIHALCLYPIISLFVSGNQSYKNDMILNLVFMDDPKINKQG